jgi:hypothetical protein
LLPGSSYKQEGSRDAFQQWRNNGSVSWVSDQGFIEETEAHLWVSSRLETAMDGS